MKSVSQRRTNRKEETVASLQVFWMHRNSTLLCRLWLCKSTSCLLSSLCLTLQMYFLLVYCVSIRGQIQSAHSPQVQFSYQSPSCPTQSIMYVHFLMARFQEIILLIIQYKYLNFVLRVRRSKVWFSVTARDYAVLDLLLNMVKSFISAWPQWSGANDFKIMVRRQWVTVP